MDGVFSDGMIDLEDDGRPRYARIADAFQGAIASGALQPGTRLPTVRRLAHDLGVSVTTILGAYNRLDERGLIRREVGRGTFVADPGAATAAALPPPARAAGARPAPVGSVPWRRPALTMFVSRLRSAYPDAVDCTSGRPDPSLLPLVVLKRAWIAALNATTHADLQYYGPEPIAPLTAQLLPRLAADGIPAAAADLVVGSSAQQFMVLALQVRLAATEEARPIVAVEEPGYPTIFDTYERLGFGLVGIELDGDGVIPESLETALAARPRAVLLTPRAHNPTGASWSAVRVAQLADVLAAHPEVLVIEDDQFAGIAACRPGSLLADPRIADRVIYIRSFSKSIAPDLRLAVAVARPHLRRQLLEAKAFADGWSSRLSQRTLAIMLADDETDHLLAAACQAYAARRAAAAAALAETLDRGGGHPVSAGDDGVNVWVDLPPDVDATAVIERTAAGGILVAPGEPFYIRPGRHEMVRINAGSAPEAVAAAAGRRIGEAALAVAGTAHHLFPV